VIAIAVAAVVGLVVGVLLGAAAVLVWTVVNFWP